MTKHFKPIGAIVVGLLVLSTAAQAQSLSGSGSGSGSSGRMWGGIGGTATALDSSTMHTQDGSAASQVNAARQGLLIGGPGISITTIGSQTIVSTTVIGDNNSTNVNARQTSNNSGNVTNNGTINTSDGTVNTN